MAVDAPRPIANITEGDLRLMRIFRVVAEAGGLTAAESRLNMERSTISRHIKGLEERLGGRLCLRGPAGFELTEFGRVAMHASITACDTLDQVRDELNLALSVLTGNLILGLADNCLTNPGARIVSAITAFKNQAPGVNLRIAVRPPNDLLDDLLTRRLHLCVVGKPLHSEKLHIQHLFDEEFRLYVGGGPSDPAPRIEELQRRGYTLVSRENDPHTRALAAQLKLAGSAVASGLEAVATFLASGSFVGFLPTHYASALKPQHGLREVAGADAHYYRTEFYLARESSRPLSAQGRLLTRLLDGAHQ